MQNQYKKNPIITDACLKIAFLKICFEKNTKKSVVGTFKIYAQ